MGSDAGFEFNDDYLFEIAVFKVEVVLPQQTVLYQSIFMSSFNFPLLFLYFLAELRIDKLQMQKGGSQIAYLEPLVHL